MENNNSKEIDEIIIKNVRYVSSKVVADFYKVSTQTVRNWVKERKISGEQYDGEYFIPAEEFEYLINKTKEDDINDAVNNLFDDDWKIDES